MSFQIFLPSVCKTEFIGSRIICLSSRASRRGSGKCFIRIHEREGARRGFGSSGFREDPALCRPRFVFLCSAVACILSSTGGVKLGSNRPEPSMSVEYRADVGSTTRAANTPNLQSLKRRKVFQNDVTSVMRVPVSSCSGLRDRFDFPIKFGSRLRVPPDCAMPL